MSSSLDTIRYHSGIAGEEVAEMVDSLEQEVSSLREQVEKLTAELDTELARNRPLQSLIKSQEEIKAFLLKKSAENKEAVKQLDSERQANALLTEQLAALAEQNEKLRSIPKWIGGDWADSIRSLHNLSTPVLNKYRAEGMRIAAEICKTIKSNWNYCEVAIRAKADELENSDG